MLIKNVLPIFCTFVVCAMIEVNALVVFNGPTPPATQQRVLFQNLRESDFRHPLDRDMTSFVRNVLPGGALAETALRRSFPLIEESNRLDLLSSAVRTSPEQFPELHRALIDACSVLNIRGDDAPFPELYVRSDPRPNAYTLAVRGDRTPPTVVVTSALVDACVEAEIRAIVGHELGHVVCEHSLWLTLGGLASAPLLGLADEALGEWRRAAEHTCDRAALLVAQDVDAVASALLKLVAGTSRYRVDVDAFARQCAEYEASLRSANPFVRATIESRRRSSTHPLPIRRVVEVRKWAESKEYRELLRSGSPIEEISE